MKTYTPAELRALANSRHTNPFFADQAKAAMHYAANVLEAADAVTAERQRAEQGDAQDAERLDYKARYEELLYAVGNKWPGESRHETALKYIQRAAGAAPEDHLIERIAQHWDACIYNTDNGEMDIGAAIRQNAKLFAASLAPPKQQPDSVHSAGGECGGVQVPKYDPRMRFLENVKGALELRIEGLSMRQIKDIFEQEYGALMWSEGCAYPSEKVKLQFIRADLSPRPEAPTGQINPDSPAPLQPLTFVQQRAQLEQEWCELRALKQHYKRVPLTEFRRMQIIGDEFPLCLVAPIVIQKIDAVCRAIEAAHGIGPAPLQGKEADHAD